MRSVIFVAAMVAPLSALADEGELYLRAGAVLNAAWLAHPAVADDGALAHFNTTPALKLSVSSELGWTNAIHVGAGLEVDGALNVVTSGLVAGGLTGDVLTGTYVAATAPLLLEWRFDSGADVSGVARLGVGPTLAAWLSSAFVDATNVDGEKRPVRLPFEIGDRLAIGGALTLAVAGQVRFSDVVVELAPSATAGWAATPFVMVGIGISPAFVARSQPQ